MAAEVPLQVWPPHAKRDFSVVPEGLDLARP